MVRKVRFIVAFLALFVWSSSLSAELFPEGGLRPSRNLQRPLAHLKRKLVATLAEHALKTAVGEAAAKIRGDMMTEALQNRAEMPLRLLRLILHQTPLRQ